MTQPRPAQAPYLLDTHTVLWAIGDPDKLSPAARDVLDDRRADVRVSAASAWEVGTKHRLGKLPHADAIVQGWTVHLRRLDVDECVVTGAHGLLAGSLAWDHRDPFDRMLAAQCLLEGMVLISSDRAFAALPGLRILW